MSSLLIVATPADTPSRTQELVAAAIQAREAGGGDIEFLLTCEPTSEDRAALAGVDHLLRLEKPLDTQTSAEEVLDVITQVCNLRKPALLILSGDELGLELGARLSVRLSASCVSGCCAFERAQDGTLHYVRPVYGGRALEVLASQAPLTVVCIQPKAFQCTLPVSAPQRQCEILHIRPTAIAASVTRVQSVITQDSGTANLEDAAIIVAGGRGVDGVNGFAQLGELARVLGGALGASRAAVDAGWISSAHQVGQTGKTVAPEIYLAVGISGAMQHLAGISAAKRVVAINTDDQAPIFGVADVGVVADAKAVVIALLVELKNG